MIRTTLTQNSLVRAAIGIMAVALILDSTIQQSSIALNGQETTARSTTGALDRPNEDNTDVSQAIEQAVSFLLENQSADGGWHSQHYGSMKQGAATTALVLYSMSHLPAATRVRHSESIEKAAQFLQTGIEKQGCVASPDGSLDYPVYSTAMILTAHKKIDLGLSRQQIKRMIGFLIASQCSASRGFLDGNPNLGGWDILGPGSTQGKTAGANVSVTYYVLEAFSLYEDPRIKPAAALAKKWCHRIPAATGDGGFYFTSEARSTLNKAGWDSAGMPRAYGSSTCDGLSILLLTGSDRQGKTVTATLKWLSEHAGIDSVPGFVEADKAHGWAFGLKFYYLNALSRSIDLFDPKTAARKNVSIAKLLVNTQNESGSWQSEFKNMREDDPLIATPLALIALANILRD